MNRASVLCEITLPALCPAVLVPSWWDFDNVVSFDVVSYPESELSIC